MLNNSKALGVADVVGPDEFVQGNVKVNLIFIAELYNTKYKVQDKEVDFPSDEDEETKEEETKLARPVISTTQLDGEEEAIA